MRNVIYTLVLHHLRPYILAGVPRAYACALRHPRLPSKYHHLRGIGTRNASAVERKVRQRSAETRPGQGSAVFFDAVSPWLRKQVHHAVVLGRVHRAHCLTDRQTPSGSCGREDKGVQPQKNNRRSARKTKIYIQESVRWRCRISKYMLTGTCNVLNH